MGPQSLGSCFCCTKESILLKNLRHHPRHWLPSTLTPKDMWNSSRIVSHDPKAPPHVQRRRAQCARGTLRLDGAGDVAELQTPEEPEVVEVSRSQGGQVETQIRQKHEGMDGTDRICYLKYHELQNLQDDIAWAYAE